MFEDKNDIRL